MLKLLQFRILLNLFEVRKLNNLIIVNFDP